MSDIKQFTTAAERAVSSDEGREIHFEIDNFPIIAYEPEPAQFAMLMASIGRGSSEMEKMAGIINFFVKILDDRGAAHIESRLLDRKDPFDLDKVEEIIDWLTEEWSGRPTQSSPASTPSRPSVGAASTQPSLLSS